MSSDYAVSPFAPSEFPKVEQIKGLQLIPLKSEERYQGRDDVLLAIMDASAISAGVFTKSCTPGAPVIWSREVQTKGSAHAMMVTAGNANVCTGKQGLENAKKMARATAKLANTSEENVFVSSTGVIGEQLSIDTILNALPHSLEESSTKQNWLASASAIMTTDTYPKAATTQIEIGGKRISISGIAKGSGMIEPNMATMLSYVFTDAAIDKGVLQVLLERAVDHSFNSITVDSDTSTSDTCLLFATGYADNKPLVELDSPLTQAFYKALEALMIDLAQQVVKDGEGAQKFISVNVTGAENDRAAKIIAKSIANSPLVKTAMAGEDANWGRIVMAVGKAGENINFDSLTTQIGGITIAEGNGPLAGYDERLVQSHIEGREIDISVDVGLNKTGSATVWTCDFTHGYIEINADYRS